MNGIWQAVVWVVRTGYLVLSMPGRVHQVEHNQRLGYSRLTVGLVHLERAVAGIRENDLEHLRGDVGGLRKDIEDKWTDLIQQVADTRSDLHGLDRRVSELEP